MVSIEVRRRRAQRVRYRLKRIAGDLPRLSVFRSSKHIYAQVIDDSKGCTLACASTLLGESKPKKGADVHAAAFVGQMIAKNALKAGIKKVVFDRGSYIYHGRIKALAEAAREGGLSF